MATTTLLDRPCTRTPDIDDDLTRRRLLSGIGALGLSVTLAGCADDEDVPEASASAPAASPSPTGAFPVRIDHKFGTTEIPAEPKRVLTIGYKEQDSVLALGVVPIAVRYWFGDEDDAIFDWATDEAGGATPPVLNMPELSYEQIAALGPDLILGINSGVTAAEYRILSDIAPTVAQSDEFVDFGVPWQVELRTIGAALGRRDEAERRVIDLEGRLSAVRAAHPEFAERTLALASYGPDQVGIYSSQDIRTRVLSDLGFAVPPEFDDLSGDKFFAYLSREQLELLDTDVLLWISLEFVEGGRSTIEDDVLVDALAVTREQRAVFIEDTDLDAALNFASVLSIPFVIDELVPALAAAVDGAPASTPEPDQEQSPSSSPSSTPTS